MRQNHELFADAPEEPLDKFRMPADGNIIEHGALIDVVAPFEILGPCPISEIIITAFKGHIDFERVEEHKRFFSGIILTGSAGELRHRQFTRSPDRRDGADLTWVEPVLRIDFFVDSERGILKTLCRKLFFFLPGCAV